MERAKDEHEHSIFPEASINHEISDDVLILGTWGHQSGLVSYPMWLKDF